MYGDLRSIKSAAINSALSRLLAVEHAARVWLEVEHRVPRLRLREPREPVAPVREEHVDESRIVRPVATIARGLERSLRRKQTRERLHVVAQMHDAHRQRDRVAGGMRRISLAVPALEREAQRLAHVGTEVDALEKHVGHFAARREVVRRPLARVLLNELHDLLALLLRTTGRRERDHVLNHLGRIPGVVHERLRANRDLVAEEGRDFVRVTGAADVAEQRHPVDGVAHRLVESGGLAHPGREETGPELRFQRLPERVVLRQRQCRDEFTQTKRCVKNGELSRCKRIRGERIMPPAQHVRSLRRAHPTTFVSRNSTMAERTNSDSRPIKVGVIADQTGPLSFVGLANANVARMVIGDINAKGGLLGREVKLYLEDSETSDAAAAAARRRLVEQDVDVILGGIYSSTRQAIKGVAVRQGRKLYIYPEQYEGEESDPLIFCTGPVPAQQVDPFIPWLMQETGAKKFYLPSADYIWPRTMNRKVREVVTAKAARSSAKSTSRSTTPTTGERSRTIVASGAEVVFNTTVPPGLGPFLEELHDVGLRAARRTSRLPVLR